MKETIKSILSNNKDSISSKRVCGIIGWLIVISISIYCTYTGSEAPEITDTITIASTTLLGVDSITNVFRKHE